MLGATRPAAERASGIQDIVSIESSVASWGALKHSKPGSARGVQRILVEQDRTVGIELADGGDIRAEIVVLAAGAWSRGIEGLPAALRPPVLPIKGQMMSLCMDPAAPLVTHVLHIVPEPAVSTNSRARPPRAAAASLRRYHRRRRSCARPGSSRPRDPKPATPAGRAPGRGSGSWGSTGSPGSPRSCHSALQAPVIRVPMDRGIHGNEPHIPNCRLYRPSLFRY